MEAGLEEQRLQQERQETQWVSEAEARAQVLRAKAELKSQERQAVQLESSSRAVDRSLGQSNKKLQVSRFLKRPPVARRGTTKVLFSLLTSPHTSPVFH